MRFLKNLLFGTSRVIYDPVFGQITFCQNRRYKDYSYWWPKRDAHFEGRFNEADDFMIYAGVEGPSEHQRNVFHGFIAAFPEIEAEIQRRLWEDYQIWQRFIADDTGKPWEEVEGFPNLSSSADAYASISYEMIEIFQNPQLSTRDCDIHLALGVPWEHDHGRAVHVLKGEVTDLFPE
jgi:hypothetical protein